MRSPGTFTNQDMMGVAAVVLAVLYFEGGPGDGLVLHNLEVRGNHVNLGGHVYEIYRTRETQTERKDKVLKGWARFKPEASTGS
jgi:hypothetical protein